MLLKYTMCDEGGAHIAAASHHSLTHQACSEWLLPTEASAACNSRLATQVWADMSDLGPHLYAVALTAARAAPGSIPEARACIVDAWAWVGGLVQQLDWWSVAAGECLVLSRVVCVCIP